jgi:hypothetical protein
MADWIPAQVIANRHWNQDLFSLSLRANIEPFKAGQFTKLGIMIGDNLIQRAYSFVNSPQQTELALLTAYCHHAYMPYKKVILFKYQRERADFSPSMKSLPVNTCGCLRQALPLDRICRS